MSTPIPNYKDYISPKYDVEQTLFTPQFNIGIGRLLGKALHRLYKKLKPKKDKSEEPQPKKMTEKEIAIQNFNKRKAELEKENPIPSETVQQFPIYAGDGNVPNSVIEEEERQRENMIIGQMTMGGFIPPPFEIADEEIEPLPTNDEYKRQALRDTYQAIWAKQNPNKKFNFIKDSWDDTKLDQGWLNFDMPMDEFIDLGVEDPDALWEEKFTGGTGPGGLLNMGPFQTLYNDAFINYVREAHPVDKIDEG